MREELKEKEVLAMYNVRRIQSYIFKSNAAKEIVGASELIEGIIVNGLEQYIKLLEESEKSNYMIDWTHDDAQAFLKADSPVQMQVLFVGGGNAYVLFRTGKICEKVNRFLGKYLLEKTYSLNLAIAVIEKTDSYEDDYKAINDEMRDIKASMPLNQPVGAMPFMAVDSITGYPITKSKDGEYFCTEAYLKRKAFPKSEDEKLFDKMVTEKGSDSTLAVCHIDGNSMGSRIKTEMYQVSDYKEAIPKMRKLSQTISTIFNNMFEDMTKYMDELSVNINPFADHKFYRKIVAAGDDITFVCNAKLALPAVEYFLKNLGERGEGDSFSACAGIAYFNSHFPFSDAYQVAEACCESAKKRAKREVVAFRQQQKDSNKETNKKEPKIGNFLDFQICTNVRAADLVAYRDRHYTVDQKQFIARPYYVPLIHDVENLNEKNKDYDIGRLKKWMKIVTTMPRSKAKTLRDTIPTGEHEVEKEASFLASRGYLMFKENASESNIWYDALEIMDLWIEEEKSDENKN